MNEPPNAQELLRLADAAMEEVIQATGKQFARTVISECPGQFEEALVRFVPAFRASVEGLSESELDALAERVIQVARREYVWLTARAGTPH